MIKKYVVMYLFEVSSFCSVDSVYYYKYSLDKFLNFCSLENITDIKSLCREDYIKFILYLREFDIKNVSVRSYARGVRVFLRWLFDCGYITNDITNRVKFPKSDAEIVKPLSNSEVSLLHSAICRNTFNLSLRNLCIFYLMLDCGLRRGEVCRLDLSDIDFNSGFITIKNSKGNKNRVVPISEKLSILLHEYIMYVRESNTAALFLDKTLNNRITKSTIICMIYKLKSVVPRVYPHLFRHTFGTSFCLGNGGLDVLKLLMGHSDISTTQLYVHIANECKLIDYDIYRLDKVFFRYCNYNYKE